jgi:hypothetical protein
VCAGGCAAILGIDEPNVGGDDGGDANWTPDVAQGEGPPPAADGGGEASDAGAEASADTGSTTVDGAGDAPTTSPITLVQVLELGHVEDGGAQTVALNESGQDLLVVAVYWNDNVATVTVSDSLGNAWQAVPAESNSSLCGSSQGTQAQLWYAPSIQAGSNTVTIRKSPSDDLPVGAFVLEYAQVATTAALDSHSGQVAAVASNEMTTGTLTLQGTSDLVVALFADTLGGGAMMAGSGYRAVSADDQFYSMVADNLPHGAGPGSATATATLPGDASDLCWTATAAAFRAR